MESLFLFFKGLIVGIGKIIPGVSGSLIAVSFHIYQKSILAINHLKDDFWNSFKYLFPIGLGIILSAILFSNFVLYLLEHYYLFTMFLFIGLICGTVPSLKKNMVFRQKKDRFFFLVSFFIPTLIPFLQLFTEFTPVGSVFDYFYITLLGFLDAATMVIPGVSGTATFMMLGSYNFVLSLFANPFLNISYTFFFGVGLIIGIFLVSKFMEIILKKDSNTFYAMIFGFLLSALYFLFQMVILQITLANLFWVLLIFFFSFLISYKFSD